ncbi:MAG: Crp/Fnr family transcriptional regulator [Bacteroidales bacterium]
MENKSPIKLISELPCFRMLTEEQRQIVQNASYLVSFGAGEVLFRKDTPVSHVMYVQSGLIKIFKQSENGRSVIFDMVTPGSFIALLTVLDKDLYQYNAAVLEDAGIVMTEIRVLRKLILENGEFAGFLLRQTSQEGLNIMSKLMNQFQKQLPGRVAEMLLFFSETIYNSKTFSLPLSRRELAEFIGTTKESMIRTLAEFRHDKIIRLEGKKVEIISPDIIHTLSRLG